MKLVEMFLNNFHPQKISENDHEVKSCREKLVLKT